jgi:hypothetical protein
MRMHDKCMILSANERRACSANERSAFDIISPTPPMLPNYPNNSIVLLEILSRRLDTLVDRIQ